MREIELKARLVNPTETVQLLVADGWQFGPKLEQHDEVYLPCSLALDQLKVGDVVLRLRHQSGGYRCTAKRRRGVPLDRDEHEFGVLNPEECRGAFGLLGYQKVIDVKKRRTEMVNPRFPFHLTLDEVDRLGTFIELELLQANGKSSSDSSGEDVLRAYIIQLGISMENIVRQPYDVALYLLDRG